MVIILIIIIVAVVGISWFYKMRQASSFSPPTIDLGSAIKMLYGNYNAASSTAEWTLSTDDADKINQIVDAPIAQAGDRFTVNYLIGSQEGRWYYILTQSASETIGGVIGAYVFEFRDNQWTVVSSLKVCDVQGLNDSGITDEQVIKLSSDQIGFELFIQEIDQGYFGTSTVIYAPINNEFRTVFSFLDLAGDNSGIGESAKPFSYSSTINFIPDPSYSFYDIELTKMGTDENEEGGIQKVNEQHLFHFNGENYIEAN